MNVDKKTFTIGILSLSAVVLIVANILAPRGVVAADTIKDNDFQLQTGRVTTGGEALYVTDSRSGMMAAFSYNPSRRTLDLVTAKAVQDGFQVAGAGRGPARR